MDYNYGISDIDFLHIKERLVNNLRHIYSNFEYCREDELIPIFSNTCIFCIYRRYKNQKCYDCWYGKEYGCYMKKDSVWSIIEENHRKAHNNNIFDLYLKGIKCLYDKYVEIFINSNNIDEIMIAKKSFLIEYLEYEKSLYTKENYAYLKKLIENEYWKEPEDDDDFENIKVSDLVDSKHQILLKNGYKHDDIIHTIKPKFIKFGSRIRIKGYDKLFILVPVRINKVSLISEDFKSYYCYDFDGISVKPIAGNKILVEDLEKIIGKDKEYTIYFTLD